MSEGWLQTGRGGYEVLSQAETRTEAQRSLGVEPKCLNGPGRMHGRHTAAALRRIETQLRVLNDRPGFLGERVRSTKTLLCSLLSR